MSIAALIRKRNREIATATVATSATPGAPAPQSVATVADVAVATRCANDTEDPHRRWRVTLANGSRISSSFTPPATLGQVQADYPGAQVAPEPERPPGAPLSDAALEVAYALLRHWGETDLATGQAWLDGLARDPERLHQMYEAAVAAGIATWDVPVEREAEPLEEPRQMASCARCRHFERDRIHPAGGLGRCLSAAPASTQPGSLWPWADAAIACKAFEEEPSR